MDRITAGPNLFWILELNSRPKLKEKLICSVYFYFFVHSGMAEGHWEGTFDGQARAQEK